MNIPPWAVNMGVGLLLGIAIPTITGYHINNWQWWVIMIPAVFFLAWFLN